jgi:hypothetical protein
MRIRSRNECEFQGKPLQRNRSIDEEQGTDNTWLPLIGHCAQIFAPRAESCVASAGEPKTARLQIAIEDSNALVKTNPFNIMVPA